MNDKQLTRLEQLDSMEWQTPAEEAEHRYLLRLQSDLRAAFEPLKDAGMHPAWVGGNYIVTGNRIVRSLTDARRLVNCQ